MRVALLSLLLAGDPGFREILEPGFSPNRTQAFDAAVARGGLSPLVRQMRRMEPALAEIDKRIEKEWKIFLDVDRRFWKARNKYGKEWAREHGGRPPAEYDVSLSLTREWFDKESNLKKARHAKYQERRFHEWVVKRACELAAALDARKREKLRAALVAGLKSRSAYQRARCARLLQAADADAAAARAAANLTHRDWFLRAEAIRTLHALGRTDALRPRLGVERGRLLEDLERALGKPDPGERFFGIKSRSERFVLLLDGTAPAWAMIKAGALRGIKALPASAQFNVIVFNESAHSCRRTLAAGKQAAIDFLERWKPGGEANLYRGLMAALDQSPDTIFLVTLADPAQGRFTERGQITAEIAGRNQAVGARIHALGRSGAKYGFWLEKLTAQFGGTLRNPFAVR